MHIGKATWDYAGSQNAQNAADGQLKPSGKQVDFIDVDLDSKTKDNVFNNFKSSLND